MTPIEPFLERLRATPPDPGFLVDEVAKGCGVTRKTVFRYLSRGQLERAATTDQHTRVTAASLRKLLGVEGQAS